MKFNRVSSYVSEQAASPGHNSQHGRITLIINAGNQYHEELNNTGEEPSLHSSLGEPNTQTILSFSVQR